MREAALAEGEPTAAAERGEDAFYRPAAPKKPRPVKIDSSLRIAEAGEPNFDDDEPFLRARRRVPVRKSWIPQSRWGKAGFGAGGLALLAVMVWAGMALEAFIAQDARFRIESSDNIQILGNAQVSKAELLSVFGGDIGRNVFFIPLSKRRGELEQLPWVARATLMRILPNQLRVSVVERTPVAFARNGATIGLVDADGVLLSMGPKEMAAKHYSFPVVTGISATDPQTLREARMRLYQRFISDLDSGGEKVSEQLSEVDLSDPEDVKALIPSQGSDILLHFGDQDFLGRFHNYQQHLAEWKQQYPHLASVDLRYERQVVLEMEKGTAVSPNQDAAGKTIDDPAKDTGAVSPVPAKAVVAPARKITRKMKPAQRRKD